MKPFLVHSTKYDGSLHYRYRMMVVREEPNLMVLYGAPGTPIDSYRGQSVAIYHALEFYWSDRFYNLIVTWHADWRPRLHYVNVATPATWHNDTLHFIDLDLDVIWRADTDEVILDDEDEFTEHQVRFGYPPDLIARVWRSSEEVRAMIAGRSYPFDGSLHAWRSDGTS
jgi:hypothetical protein